MESLSTAGSRRDGRKGIQVTRGGVGQNGKTSPANLLHIRGGWLTAEALDVLGAWEVANVGAARAAAEVNP